jgi:Xaa-Pro aminopeptidase
MIPRERVAAIRRLMRKEGLAAYLIPSTDPHLSEYVPDYWQRRKWISGFTGSMGDVVITMKEAGLWTDGRYFLQAETELDPEVFKLFKMYMPGTPTIDEYLVSALKKGKTVGVDAQTLSKGRAEKMEQYLNPRGIKLKFPASNFVDKIWDERPPVPVEPAVVHPARFACQTVGSKLSWLRSSMVELDADSHVLSALDSIAWLFNLRGSDVDYNPVVISYAIVNRRGATLFIDSVKLPPEVKKAIRPFAQIKPYREFGKALRALAKKRAKTLVDPETANRWIIEKLKGAPVIFAESPVVAAKAKKNAKQLNGIQAAHVQDGIAMVRFFHWLENELPETRLTEVDIVHKLTEFRSQGRYFRGESFSSIVGFGGNGAIIHYNPVVAGGSKIRKRGLLLIDSGGQYWNGTTDITRTIAIGQPTRKEIRFFTRVLQGHIALTSAVFPEGVAGGRLEVLARSPLWEDRKDYNHGTGHGVGHHMCVHEGPMGFSTRNPAAIVEGNVLTNEPGYYEAGKFGIRIENQVAVVPEKSNYDKGERVWFKLHDFTLCPLDRELINVELMTEAEVKWVNDYHRRVRKELLPYLSAAEKRWLRNATQPI